MPLHWFWPPVRVLTDKPGRVFEVTNVEKAAEFLLAWAHPGPLNRKAREACLLALEGGIPPEDVRPAFEAAAKECGKLLP